MADSPMLARRLIRLAALDALKSDTDLAGVNIESPGDWTTPPSKLPAILMRSPSDRKESIAKTSPEFTTNVIIEIEARDDAKNPEEAQDNIEDLCFKIEQALLTNYGLIRLINQVASVDTKTEISADGKIHFGAAMMIFTFELPEMFEPVTQFQTLDNVQLHADMQSPFDPSGTYTNPPFPSSVTPAPRTSGPDGRDEGALNIDLTQ